MPKISLQVLSCRERELSLVGPVWFRRRREMASSFIADEGLGVTAVVRVRGNG